VTLPGSAVGLSPAPPVAQLVPATGPPLAVLGTVVLAAAFYAVTVHVAARFVLGEVPLRPALGVGVVLAVVSFLLRSHGVALVAGASLLVDAAAIKSLYALDWRPTAWVTLAHFAVSVVLGYALVNLVGLLVG